MNSTIRLVLIIIAPLLLVNCVAVGTFPLAARAGDTVTVAVGSFEGMTTTNTTVEYVSDLGPTFDLTSNIRAIPNIYPDKTSHAWSGNTFATAIPGATAHGPWQTIMVLDLPSTLPVSTGHFNIQTTADPDVVWSVLTNISDVQIPMEIIAGTGTSNDFSYYGIFGSVSAGDFSLLTQRKQAIVKFWPNPSAPSNFGAIEITVNANIIYTATGLPVPKNAIKIIPGEFPSNIDTQRQLSWAKSGNNITAYIISPVGMYAEEGRFSIVIPDNAKFDTTPTLGQIAYYGLNGNVIAGPVPSIAIVP